MPTHYTPTAAAALVGVSVSSLRNWTHQFSNLLSADAHPPAGQERRLSARDVAILQRVGELRRQGMTTADIRTALQNEDLAALEPFVDVVPTEATEATEPATEAAFALQVAQSVHERLQRLEAVVTGQDERQRSGLLLFAAGVVVGVLLVVAALLLVYLGAAVGR